MKNLFPKTHKEFEKFFVAFFLGEAQVFAFEFWNQVLLKWEVFPKAIFIFLLLFGGFVWFNIFLLLGFQLWHWLDQKE